MPQSRSLDPAGVIFPTDRITFGEMRKLEPERFTREALHRRAVANCDVFYTYTWELALAEKAFAKAIGEPDPNSDYSRKHIIEDLLHEGYQQHGLSRGINETRRLAAQIEAAARQQAAKISGQTR